MRRIYILSAALLLVLSGFTAKAQRFEVPANYNLETKDDYHKYDNDIIKCVNWLEKTPAKESNNKIKHAGDFLAEWLTGCPYVRFSQNVRVDAVFSNSPRLRVYYMGGWARYALQNQGKATQAQCCIAGLRCLIKVYEENKSSLERDPNVDELVNADKQGKLQEWVDDRM